jgi:hypothetical protein
VIVPNGPSELARCARSRRLETTRTCTPEMAFLAFGEPRTDLWFSAVQLSPEKGGALRTHSIGGRRACVAALCSGALVALPLLLLQAGPARAARGLESTTADSEAAAPQWQLIYSRSLASASTPTTTTAPPATTTTTAPPVTTTTRAPAPSTTTTTTPAKAVVAQNQAVQTAAQGSDSATGGATWYAEAPSGTCASPTLPFGTTLQVTNNATGATTTCLVEDREADNPGRVVDMSVSGFSQLGDTSQGVISVTISW